LGGALGSGGIGTVASAITEALKLVNHLTEDDPVKQAKVNRQFILKLVDIVKEARQSETGADLTDLVIAITKLLDA
jgi:hypothetical protein